MPCKKRMGSCWTSYRVLFPTIVSSALLTVGIKTWFSAKVGYVLWKVTAKRNKYMTFTWQCNYTQMYDTLTDQHFLHLKTFKLRCRYVIYLKTFKLWWSKAIYSETFKWRCSYFIYSWSLMLWMSEIAMRMLFSAQKSAVVADITMFGSY